MGALSHRANPSIVCELKRFLHFKKGYDDVDVVDDDDDDEA